MTSILPRSVDYTDKDFDALRERLIRLIRSIFPDWTDFNVLSFGNLLMELMAFVGDVLGLYQDNQANEAFIVTATQRRSIIALAKLIGFELPTQTAASVDTRLFLPDGPTPGSVTFPVGTIVRTLEITDPVRFQLLAEAVIPAGADPAEITGVSVENSETVQDTRASTGLRDQEFLLLRTPYLDGSMVISTPQGTFTEVDNFLESEATDRHFTVSVDQNDRARVRFGDGIQGLIPTGTITFDFKIGGGSDGNVEVGDIQVVEGTFQDSFGNPVRVGVENLLKASGGGPRMSVATARLQAPLSLRVLNRTVAREDYEINALKVPGVARALMLTSDQDPGIPENQGQLTIIPTGGGVPSTALKDAVLVQVTETFPNTVTFKLFVVDPSFLAIDISATVFLQQGANSATVRAAILASLQAFFDLVTTDASGDEIPNPNVDFGFNFKDASGNPAGEVAFSDVYNAVRDTSGVRKIGDSFEDFLLNLSDRDVPLENDEFPIIGNVTIINGDTGLDL